MLHKKEQVKDIFNSDGSEGEPVQFEPLTLDQLKSLEYSQGEVVQFFSEKFSMWAEV